MEDLELPEFAMDVTVSETLPSGPDGGMDPTDGVVSQDNTPQESGRTLTGRPKNSAIMAQLEEIKELLLARPAPHDSSMSSPALSSGGSDPSGLEVNDEPEDDASGVPGARSAETQGHEGGAGVSTDLADAVEDVTEVVTKAFRGLRLGNWNYGKKPQ